MSPHIYISIFGVLEPSFWTELMSGQNWNSYWILNYRGPTYLPLSSPAPPRQHCVATRYSCQALLRRSRHACHLLEPFPGLLGYKTLPPHLLHFLGRSELLRHLCLLLCAGHQRAPLLSQFRSSLAAECKG
jgi:hypothetical protein